MDWSVGQLYQELLALDEHSRIEAKRASAIGKSIMHRDYQVHQPTLVVRYSNRLEIRNAGYSLKPETMLGEMGSQLRNPILASVLYDLDFAETKGTGIRTMRRLLQEIGLTVPVFVNYRAANQFTAIYLLHQLLGEEQLTWLQQFSHLKLSDHEAKALILAKETGAVDNAALRSITGMDTLAVSQVLRKLHHQLNLLIKGGAGPSTYYQLPDLTPLPLFSDLDLKKKDTSDSQSKSSDLQPKSSDLQPKSSDLPEELLRLIDNLPRRASKEKLWPIILWLCSVQAQSAEQLAEQLNRKREMSLKTSHLNPMRKKGLIDYLYPDVVHHPGQAYVATENGKQWLQSLGLAL